MLWPVNGEVASMFGKQLHPQLPDTYVFNKGITVNTQYGNPVISLDNGNVLYAKEFMEYGKIIIIDHGNGLCAVYGKLEELNVKVNDMVNKEQVIAESGTSLYFEIRIDGKPDDPLKWLKAK
jgi:septal ring factor EnvC (AmiA/AmiB activator)